MSVEKKDLLRFLEGQKKAQELMRTERRKRLARLTTEESWREYEALCELWETSWPKENLEALEKRRILFLVERRKRFNQAGGLEENK